jgi:hypothetical protein
VKGWRRWIVGWIWILLVASSHLITAPPASASFPGAPGEVAYTVTIDGHRAIYATPPVDIAPHALIDLGDRSASQAAWGPAGQKLAFTGEVSAGGPTAIFVSDADGSNVYEVTFPSDGEADSDPSWSPSGEEIVFARRLPSGRSELLKVDLSTLTIGALPLPAWVLSASEPAWSPGGSSIAFVGLQSAEDPCQSSACRWSLYVVDAIGGEPRLIDAGVDHHDPEWSPDGKKIIATLGVDSDPFSLGVVYLVETGQAAFTLANSSNFSPSWSPEGDEILVQFGSTRSLIVSYDTNGQLVRVLVEGAEPAWRSVPDTLGPTIEFHPSVMSSTGWLGGTYGAWVGILAKDGSTVTSLSCTVDGEQIPDFHPQPGRNGSMEALVFFTTDGHHVLSCEATDGFGNASSRTQTFPVDVTPASVGVLSVTPRAVRVGEGASASVEASDGASGLCCANLHGYGWTSGSIFAAMRQTESGFAVTLDLPDRPEVWTAFVEAWDNVGLGARTPRTLFVSYDPEAGSIGGTGWIIPGGPTSEPGDHLPGLDGTSKASFGFGAKYRSASSTVPSGTLTFSYGSRFKLQSKDFAWLVVADLQTAYLGGTATIQGVEGEFPFILKVGDRGDTAPDRFVLQVFGPGANLAVDAPMYQASGDVGGQIMIQT